MMETKAFNTPHGILFRVYLDTTKLAELVPAVTEEVIVTPAVTDEQGTVITPAVTETHVVTPAVIGPDPAWVCEWTWGKEPPEGQTMTEYLQACKREAELLAAEELARRQPPEEISLPI